MENLTIHEASPAPGGTPQPPHQQVPGAPTPQQQPGGPPPPPPMTVPQLPPQMFTTAAQLLDLTDKKLMVSLRDGRKLIGVLRSWDQFANIVLQDTIERIYVQNLYADIQRGIFLVRGENVLLLGEIDLDKDDYIPEPFEQAPIEKVFALQRQEQEERKKRDKRRRVKLQTHGFEGEQSGETLF
ncbi:putative small nuclear ribonucleoprotein [Phyllosticta citrichinensis]|uniref:U6 snRNA-associated Sm-like protein LSm1 n=1 Tax=Phyllosticta citrichinensis TaxID=1130410 RepID=A0ABR1Y197_9PEZI